MGIVEDILNGLEVLGPYGVFIGVVIENIITIIPSALIPLMAGATIIPKELNPTQAILSIAINIGLIGAIASTLINTPYYAIGYISGKRIIDKYGRYIGTSWDEVEKYKLKIEDGKFEDITIIALRIIPIIPISPISIALGAIRYNIKKFVTLTIIGTIPRYIIIGIIGWASREIIWTIAKTIDTMENIVIAGMIIGIIAYIIKKRRGIQLKTANKQK
jgi:membrane protein DedA with SNARE-associated domain